jgi:hypothetical protein
MVSAHVILIALVGLQLLAQWAFSLSDVTRREWFYEALPWIVGSVVALKFALAGWALRALRRREHLVPNTIVRLLGAWTLTAVLLFGLLAWSVVPTYALALAVVLALPLARPLAAPLAFAWNRHR